MEMSGTNFKQKTSKHFCCEKCQYITDRKSNFLTHLTTAKHFKEMSGNNFKQKTSNTCICNICNKTYQTSSGLWKHKKVCNTTETNKEDDITEKELIIMLLKQNSQLIEQNAELVKNGIQNTNNYNTNINSHNKSFNLHFFLNETCKDAMNIMDFVETIKLQLTDLEKIGEVGYVNGISNIIVKNLKQLDITERPVHCTDKKRETLYIKDENKWEKEDDENNKMRKVIKKVANKNIRLLQKFKEEHPDCCKSDSKYSDQYNKLIVESMGGTGDNDVEKEDKIIKKIAKEVTIDK
jgi:hypothetical protein